MRSIVCICSECQYEEEKQIPINSLPLSGAICSNCGEMTLDEGPDTSFEGEENGKTNTLK